MKNISDLETAVSEISYELSLWPISPTNVLHVGDQSSYEIVRRYFDYAKLTFICMTNANWERSDLFWNSAKWGQHQDLVISLNLFTTQTCSRTPNFFSMARASLAPDGRLIALEHLLKTSAECETLKTAADQGGMRLISALPLESDNRWSCLVFENT